MRLLTYNIHKGIGSRDRRYRLDRIIDVIERENPDLVCLQEVTRDAPRCRHDNQPRTLGQYFHYAERLFQLNVHYKRGGYGNLMLSRWPVVERHHVSLRFNTRKQRGAQLAVVDTPEGALHLVNWHLGLGERERHWQVRRLLTSATFRKAEALPTLIVGDTNDWRNTLAKSVFTEFGFTKTTAPSSRYRTFPAYLPVGSLDKVFQRGPLTIRRTRVVRTRLAKRASDHLPVVVDFHLGTGD